MRKITTVLTLASVLYAQVAGAKTLAEMVQKPQCFAAQYDSAHLSAHPKQKVRAVWVYVMPAKMADYTGEQKLTSGLDGMGSVMARFKNDRAFYGSDGVECTVEPDGVWHCGIECDGGQFTMQANQSGGILMKPTHDGYIRVTSCDEAPKQRYIESADDQKVFSLRPAALSVCQGLMKKFK